MRLILIRHGASVHAAEGRIAVNRGCGGLTAPGRAEVAALTQRLLASGELQAASLALSSPTPRAWETALLLQPALAQVPFVAEPALRELDPGEADGMLWADFRQRYASFEMSEQPERPFGPGGESFGQFTNRVLAWCQHMAVEHAGATIVAATHGGVITATLLGLLGIPRPGTGAQVHPRNATITEWHHRQERWELVRFNA